MSLFSTRFKPIFQPTPQQPIPQQGPQFGNPLFNPTQMPSQLFQPGAMSNEPVQYVPQPSSIAPKAPTPSGIPAYLAGNK